MQMIKQGSRVQLEMSDAEALFMIEDLAKAISLSSRIIGGTFVLSKPMAVKENPRTKNAYPSVLLLTVTKGGLK